MEVFLDCLPCMLRQMLESSRLATDDPQLQARIMDEAMAVIARYKDYSCSPEMTRVAQQAIQRLTGVADPYHAIKRRDIATAKKLLPFLKQFLQQKKEADQLFWALKISAVGNVIDSAVHNQVDIAHDIERELEKPFAICDLPVFAEQLQKAKNILIVGDNAGETVFDRVLIEHLDKHPVTYALRSEPAINDATLQDAIDSGLDRCARLVTSGCPSPGTVLSQCSADFLQLLQQADLVISKGQGNYEGLAESVSRPVFFLLKAKCAVIARRLDVALNDYVFRYQTLAKHSEK